MPAGAKQTLRFGSFELDPHCGQLRKDGLALKLLGQPIQILEILLENNGELVTRDELRQRLWASDTFVDFDHSLNTAIKKLRQALGDEADKPRYIETVPKRGYRFIGNVNGPVSNNAIVEQKAEARAPSPVVVLPVQPVDSEGGVRTERVSPRKVALISLAAVAGIALMIALYWVTKPPRMPRIVASHALTKTGLRKTWFVNRLVTDGTTIYFQEARQAGAALMRVSVKGGEVSEVPGSVGAVGSVGDISKDGSELLLTMLDPSTLSVDAWIQPLPIGPPRLVIKDVRFPVFSKDGSSILFSRRDKELFLGNLDGTNIRHLATFPDITGLALSPDGRRIRVGVGPTGSLLEAGSDGSNPHPIFTEQNDSLAAGDWSPDGNNYFFLGWDGERFNLWVASEERRWWRRRAAPLLRQLTFGPLWIGIPSVSKDGKQIYAVGREPHGELSVYDQRTGRFVPYLGGMSACYVDFSKDGEWIAYVSYPEGTLWRSRVDGTERRQLTVPPLAVINPRWSPDGKLIAFTDWSRGNRRRLASESRIYAVSANGGGPMLLLAGDEGAADPTWAPDGTAIAYFVGGSIGGAQQSEIRILDLHNQKITKIPGSNGHWSPRWSPDGKYLAALVNAFPSKLALYSFATQKWTEFDSQGFDWPSWSRDSSFVYAAQGARSIVRIAVPEGKVEQVASLTGFPSTAYGMLFWYGLTPDGRLVSTRDTGIEEVYAFDLEYK